MNGGTYNLLLNTSSKTLASLAACLSVLAYTATAVVSASEAAAYAHNLLPVNPLVGYAVCLTHRLPHNCLLCSLGQKKWG